MEEKPLQENFKLQADELNLLELWGILWERKIFITITIVIFASASVLYSLLLTDIFRAQALLYPAAEDSRPQFGEQIALAASLGGVNIAQSNNNTISALAILRSRTFTKKFVAEHSLRPWLFASNYDFSEARSIIDTTLYDLDTNTWLGEDASMIPTDGEVFELFRAIFNVTEDQVTGLVTVAIEWPNPALAAQWVNWLIHDLNEHVRSEDIKEAQLAIDYLRKQLESTQLVEMQRVFYQLIESQTRVLMLADIKEGYVFETIDPAVAPEQKSRPRRSLICIIGTLLGGILAIIYVLAKYYLVDSIRRQQINGKSV